MTEAPLAPNRRASQRAWFVYDWANSAFFSTVVTVFFGPYVTSLARQAADPQGFIHPFGIQVNAGSFFPYIVSLSVFLQVLVLPVLGAVADHAQRKRLFLAVFTAIGTVATMAMWTLDGQEYLRGGLLFLTANLSAGACIVFYNAFLPEIASPEERNRVSSQGWAIGYLGGGVLLAANLALFAGAARWGLSTGEAVRWSLFSAGVWWALFALYPLSRLRDSGQRTAVEGGNIWSSGFQQLGTTLRNLRRYPQTLLFLIAYLLYNDGIQTVIALASQFGQEELGLSMSTLTSAILMVQFVAFAGALVFQALARSIGAKSSVMVSLVIWTGTLIYAYLAVQTAFEFYVLAAIIGLVMGGSQALSRALFSQMIPPGKEAEYFSLYEISDRGTSWLGPLLFGLALQQTQSYRVAILSLIIFFIVGLVLLSRVQVEKAVAEAQSIQPA